MSQLNPLHQTHTLHLCYFGVREPLVQTQVLPYLRQIAADGVKVSLLTFEPNFKESWTAEQITEQKNKFAAENIDWHCLAYHKRYSVPATLYDALAGARFAARMVKNQGVNVLHARVHVPAMMGILAKKMCGSKKPQVIFDIRGFMPEEYVDGGMWKKDGLLFRTIKRVERRLLAESDAFVVLTEKAREILFPESKLTGFDKQKRPVEVIPCCVDLKRFQSANAASRKTVREELKLNGRRVFIYVGSFQTWYLADEMADLLAAARQRDNSMFALVLTQSAPEIIISRLKAHGFTEQDFYVAKVPPADIPRYLSAADVAISFIKACYSKLSSSPTKIAEYLAGGLPIICNRGVGDVDEMIETNRVGAIVKDFNAKSYAQALETIENLQKDPTLADRCRASAENRFDLIKVGGEKYKRLYRSLNK